MKVTINTSSFGQQDQKPLELLRAQGLAPVMNPHKRTMTPAEVVALCADADGIIAGTESLDAGVLAQLTRLKVISRCGTGMNNVDVKAAEARGIKVFNTPGAPTAAVAELVVGQMLSMLRRTFEMDRKLRAGVWEKKMGNLLSGKTVGIVGFGRIGRKVAELLRPFGVEIIYTDPREAGKDLKVRKVSLTELLERADIVTLHAAVEDGKVILGEAEIRRMKKGAWLMNLSRGEALDENALCSALRDGHLSGAALDVYRQEPYEGSLKGLENIILTPHVGSYAAEARVLMEIEAVENLLKGLGL
jgi:D-3-phosphoglycerate dehydrogenase